MRTESTHRSGTLHHGIPLTTLILAVVPVLFCLLLLVDLTAASPLPGDDKQTGFVYQLENRPDPFVPFLSEKAVSAPTVVDEIIEEDIELTGMRRFEPGQLKLVAILLTKKEKIAMVEDVTGRGYILTEGMPIGRHGTVTAIQPQQVQITETAHTRLGKELVNTVVMRLNTEGEK